MTLIFALMLEYVLGDPPNRWHPVAWFGRWANVCERLCFDQSRIVGVLAWCITIAIPLLILGLLYNVFGWLFAIFALWLSIGWKSLFHHVQAVLDAKTVEEAREALRWIVSRDVHTLKHEDTRRAALESLAENASDAVVAPLFWFVILGPMGVVFYRMVNTLDAMWGYRNERYQYFGWCAAKVDDVMNYIPARITAWLMLSVGQSVPWSTLKAQATTHASPNAGYPEVALAYAANIKLGGDVIRGGKVDTRPYYGAEFSRNIDAIAALEALQVVKTTLIWASFIALGVSIVF
ncbi:MAG: adenosylcobinamide-phosphate synthase CbiB [Ghiorsea sp.]|nr:adenosylcobinamide-phosphate synthase CbiB [Ghiorsea sp.]